MSRGAPPPDISGMVSLKVGNLPYRTIEADIKGKFRRYGDIGDVYIPKDRDNRSKGFAFVRYYSRRDADDAIDAMDGREFEGRRITVKNALPPRGSRGNDGWRRSRSRSRSRSRARRRSRSRSRSRTRRTRSRSRSRSRSRPRRSRSLSKSPRGDERNGRSRSASRSASRENDGSAEPVKEDAKPDRSASDRSRSASRD